MISRALRNTRAHTHTEIPDPKGSSHNRNHHSHSTQHAANVNELYKTYKTQHHRPPKVTYQPISDDDDLFGSADEYDDVDMQNEYTRTSRTPTDGSVDNGASNSNDDDHHSNHQHSHNTNRNNHNNNMRYNNIQQLFGSGTHGNGVGAHNGVSGGSGTNGNGNAIVTRSDIRGVDNEVSTATASANIIVAFYEYNGHYYNYKLFGMHLLISILIRSIVT